MRASDSTYTISCLAHRLVPAVLAAAQLLIWARRGVLPPTISLEGDPLHTMLHIRGPFWQGGDLGWMPCIYSMRTANAACGTSAASANRRGWVQYNRSRPHVRQAMDGNVDVDTSVTAQLGTRPGASARRRAQQALIDDTFSRLAHRDPWLLQDSRA